MFYFALYEIESEIHVSGFSVDGQESHYHQWTKSRIRYVRAKQIDETIEKDERETQILKEKKN
ncbi:unnamed protein product [Camellia sinensis]